MNPQHRAAADIVLYGLAAGLLIALLRLIEYRFLVLEYSAPIYGGIIAALFAAIGIRLGQKLTGTKTVERVVVQEVRIPVTEPWSGMPARPQSWASHRASWKYSS